MDNLKLKMSDNINEDDHLYRYMSLAQFISLVENKMLFLRKVKLWDDPWEAPDDQIPIIDEKGKERLSESLITSSTVGQCWTYEKDSDAMWRIYSSDRQGIMVETIAKNFYTVDNLRHASLAKVEYYNKGNYIEKRKEVANNSSYSFAGDMILKREAFKHENEVRLLVCLQGYNNVENIWDTPVIGFGIEPELFIKSITFDPRADEWYVDSIKKYCMSKNFKCPIEKSNLYKKDFYESTRLTRKYELVK